MVSRAEIKLRAKKILGENIFGQTWMMALVACLIASTIQGVSMMFSILLMGPLSYGLAYVFVRLNRCSDGVELGDLFKGFTTDFGGTLLIGLMTSIFTALWSLLLVIPGIVKAYAYSMAQYVKIDHPEYDWRQCMKESQRLMTGYKGKLFMLDLSFIGWIIVGALCLGVGTLWVTTYQNAAHAVFYEKLLSEPRA